MISTHLPLGAAHLPAHARGRRRPARDHDHRGLLHRRPARSQLLAWPLVPIAAFGVLRPAADPHARCCCVPLAVRRPGRWSTSPASTPPWPACSSAFTVPVLRRDGREGRGLAEHFEHLVRPMSAGVAVPVFAFFAAGVDRRRLDGLAEALTDPVALGHRRRTGGRQDRRHRRGRRGCCHVHPCRARRRAVLGRRGRAVDARRRRLHGVAADRRARVRPGSDRGRARQGRRARRLAPRRRPRRRRAAAAQPRLPAHLRGRGARRRQRRRPRRLRAGRPSPERRRSAWVRSPGARTHGNRPAQPDDPPSGDSSPTPARHLRR